MKKYFLFMTSAVLTVIVISHLIGCASEKTPCEKEDSKTITKTGIIGENHPSISLSVYDDGGGLVADAACHAQMEIKFQWDSPGLSEMPPLKLDFLTVFGYFPQGPIVEVEKGVYKCSVNEAEDKSTPGETSYGTKATINKDEWGNAAFPDVKVEMKITYKLYNSEAYTGQ